MTYLVREFGLTIEACLDVTIMSNKVEAAMRILHQECPICCDEHMRDEVS